MSIISAVAAVAALCPSQKKTNKAPDGSSVGPLFNCLPPSAASPDASRLPRPPPHFVHPRVQQNPSVRHRWILLYLIFFYKRPEGGAGVDLQRHIGLTSDIRRCDTFILLPLVDLFSIWCVRPLGNNIRSLPPPTIFIPLLFTRKRTPISVNIDAAYGPHESNSVRTYSDYGPDRSIFDPPS